MTLEERLTSLGEHLDLGDVEGAGLPERVTAQIDTADTDRNGRPGQWLRYAAAVLLVAALTAVAVPASRDTMASWFGLDGVRIERRPDAPSTTSAVETSSAPSSAPSIAPSSAPSIDSDASGLPGPGHSWEVTVDGRVVLVSVIEGALANEALVKTLGPNTDIVEVTVGNAPGLWISGAPHDLAYWSPDGMIAFERVAGNTLVWQDNQQIGRLEGFESVAAALKFATELGTNN